MNNDKILCPRCGGEIHSNSRYCMKCGYLNYNHPDNVSLRGFQGNLQDTTAYVNGTAQLKNFVGIEKNHELRFGSKTGNKQICFLVNFILYILSLVGVTLFFSSKCDIFLNVIYTSLPYFIVIISLFFMYLYAFELIIMKMNEKWWVIFIPFYNIFAVSKKVMGSYLFGIFALIPVISFIYLLILTYKLGKKFGYNGLLFMLFWPFLIPSCGFGDNSFDGVTYVAGLDASSLEKEYKLKNSFIIFITSILIVSLIIIGYLNIYLLKDPINSIKKYYYVYASRAIVKDVKTNTKIRTIHCDNGVYSNYKNGEYYFYYSSANKEVGLLFGSSKDEIESYVKVVIENGKIEYYISLTDGTYGIEEMDASNIKVKDVKKMKKLPDIYLSGNKCRIKNQ